MPRPLFPSAPVVEAVPLVEETKAAPKAEPASARPKTPAPTQETPPVKPAAEPIKPAVAAPIKAAKAASKEPTVEVESVEMRPSSVEPIWSAEDREEFLAQLNERTAGMEYEEAKKQIAPTLIAYSAAKGSDPAKEMAAATRGAIDIHAISHDVLQRRGPAEDSLLRRTLMPAATTPEAKAEKATLAAVEDAPVAAVKTKREADQIATIRAATKADPEKAAEETAIESQSIPAIALSERTTDFFGDDPTKDPEVTQGVMQDWAKGLVAQIPKEHALAYVSGFNRVTADSSELIGDNAERILRERGITLKTNGITFVVRSRNPQDIKQRYVEAGGKIEDLGATEAERVASADNAAAEAYRRAYAKAINEIAALRTTGGITSPVRISIPYSKLLGISPEGTFSFSDEVPRLMLPEGDGWGPKDIIKERGVAGYLEAALNAAAPRMEIVGFKRGPTPGQQAILLRQSGAAETWLDRIGIMYNINKEIAGGALDRKGMPFYKDEETGEWTMYGPNDFVGNVLEGFANRENSFEDVQNSEYVKGYIDVVNFGPDLYRKLGINPPEPFLNDYNNNGEIDDEDIDQAWRELKGVSNNVLGMLAGGTAAVLEPDVIDFGIALDAPAALRRARTAFQANPDAIDLLKVEADALAAEDYEKAQTTTGLLGKREGISRSSDSKVDGSAPDLSTTVLVTDTAVALEARAAGRADEMFDTGLIERLPAVRYPDSELDITIPRDNHIHGSQQSKDASRRARYDLVEKNNNLDAMEAMVAKGEGNFPELQVKAANANLRQLLADGVDRGVVGRARALIRQGKFNDAQTLIKGMTNQDHIDLLTEAADLASEARLAALEEAPEAIERARVGVRQQAESRRQAAQEVYDWVRHNDEKGALAQRLDKIAPWFTRQVDRFRAARSVTEFWRRAGLEQVADVAVSEKKRAQIEKAAKDLTNARKTLLQARENASKAISAAEVNRWNDRIDKAGERLRERADKYAAIAAGFKLEGLSPAGQRLFARVLEVTDELNITVEQALIAVLQAEWNARRVVEEGRANSLDEVLDTYEFRLGGDPNTVGGEVLRAEEEAKRLARVQRGEGERVFGFAGDTPIPDIESVPAGIRERYNKIDAAMTQVRESQARARVAADAWKAAKVAGADDLAARATALQESNIDMMDSIRALAETVPEIEVRTLADVGEATALDMLNRARLYAYHQLSAGRPPRIQRDKSGRIIKGPTNAIKEVTPISLDIEQAIKEVRELPWFHGVTRADADPNAQMKDYDYRIHSGTGAGNMFGPGKYLASNPERAIDYAAMSGKPLGSGTAGKSTVRALDVKPERLLDIRLAAAKKKGLTLGEYVAEQLKAGGVEEDLVRQFRGARSPEEIGDILNRFKEPAAAPPDVPTELADRIEAYAAEFAPDEFTVSPDPSALAFYLRQRRRMLNLRIDNDVLPETRGAMLKEEALIRGLLPDLEAYLDLPWIERAGRFDDIVMKFDGLLHLGRKDGNVLVLFDPNGKINGRAILKSESRILPDEVLYQQDDVVDSLDQNAKAFVQFTADGKKIVHLMKTADFSSLTHELGHIFRRNLSVKDNATVEKWVKAQGLDATIDPATGKFNGVDKIEAEERFARGYERWVREGKSPLKAMQPIYDKMKQWMLSIYKGLTNTSINVTLSPDIEMVFARMVTPDSLMDTVAPSITGERLTPKAGKAPMSAATWLSDQLKAKGVDLSAADIQSRWDKGDSIDLPFKVGGKSQMSPDDALAIQLAVDSVAALQARKADFTTAYDDTRQSVMEETLVDDVQAGLSAPNTAREEMALGTLGRWGVKGLARAAATVTLGADAVKHSRLFSPRVRDLAKQAERILNQRVGDFNVLLREIQEGNYGPLFDYLTGNETVFAVGGRRPLSTGHDAAREAGNIIGDMHQGFPFKDSDGKPIMLKVLPDNAGTAGNQKYIKLDGDVTDNIAEAAEPQQVLADLIGLMMQTMKEHTADKTSGDLSQKVKSLMANKQVSGALRPAMAYMLEGSPFVRHIAHAVFKQGNEVADAMDAHTILKDVADERIFALVDALFKLNGASVDKVGGAFKVSFDPGLTSYHNLAEFIEAMRKGGFNTEHVNRALAVINVFGSYSTAHKAVEEVGYSFTKAQKAIHRKFLKGQVEDPVEFAEGLRMFAEFGYNYDALDEVATMIEGQPTMRYIPGDIQRRIGAALGRALDEDTQSTKKLADAVAKPPAVARWAVGLHQRDLARGVYLAKGPKAVMDLTDTFAMNAIAGGAKHAAAVTARQIVQTMFASLQGHVLTKVVSLGSQALGKGAISSDDVRMLAQRLGDMLSDNLTMAKVQIDTNEIVKGSNKIIDMGDGRRYKASDLLDIAIRNGTVASFESSEIKASVRKSLELKLANDAGFAEQVLGRGKRGVQTANRQWLEANAELFEALAERERLNTMIVFMQAGKTPNEAAALTTKILFDYPGSLAASETKSTWTGLLLTAIHPFWTWQKNANHFVVNALENPAVAYRMGVMRRAIETGPEAVSNAIFAMQVDPYGFDPNNMPPEARRVYFYMRQAYEESLEKEAWEMTEEERLTFAAFIWQNHPATPQMIRGDSVVSLDSQVRLKTKDKWEAMPDAGMIGPSGFAPPPNLDRVREWQRNCIRFMLRLPQTEAIRDYARITGQDDLMLSVVFYEPGTLGAANYLANVLNLVALPATLYNASGSSLQTGEEFRRAFDTILNPERAPVFSQILAAINGQSQVRLAQPIAEMLEQRGGLDALLVSKQRDPVAEASFQADVDRGIDESVAGAKYPTQYYASPFLSWAISLTPALADVNRTGIRMENNGAFARMPTLAKVRTILMMTGWVSSIDETSMETAALDAQYDTPIKALPR